MTRTRTVILALMIVASFLLWTPAGMAPWILVLISLMVLPVGLAFGAVLIAIPWLTLAAVLTSVLRFALHVPKWPARLAALVVTVGLAVGLPVLMNAPLHAKAQALQQMDRDAMAQPGPVGVLGLAGTRLGVGRSDGICRETCLKVLLSGAADAVIAARPASADASGAALTDWGGFTAEQPGVRFAFVQRDSCGEPPVGKDPHAQTSAVRLLALQGTCLEARDATLAEADMILLAGPAAEKQPWPRDRIFSAYRTEVLRRAGTGHETFRRTTAVRVAPVVPVFFIGPSMDGDLSSFGSRYGVFRDRLDYVAGPVEALSVTATLEALTGVSPETVAPAHAALIGGGEDPAVDPDPRGQLAQTRAVLTEALAAGPLTELALKTLPDYADTMHAREVQPIPREDAALALALWQTEAVHSGVKGANGLLWNALRDHPDMAEAFTREVLKDIDPALAKAPGTNAYRLGDALRALPVEQFLGHEDQLRAAMTSHETRHRADRLLARFAELPGDHVPFFRALIDDIARQEITKDLETVNLGLCVLGPKARVLLNGMPVRFLRGSYATQMLLSLTGDPDWVKRRLAHERPPRMDPEKWQDRETRRIERIDKIADRLATRGISFETCAATR